MRTHIVVSINGLRRHLASIKSKDKRKLYCFECFGCSLEDTEKEMIELEAQGYDCIPCNECDNRNEKGHCLGHNDEVIL